MNSRLIRMIIALMFLAMTGLVGIQIYWIREAVQQRESQFQQSVYDALANVVYEYEKYRVTRDFERIFGKESFQQQFEKQLDSLGQQTGNKDGKYDEITINAVGNGMIWYSTRSHDGSIENNGIVDPFGMDGTEFFPELHSENSVDGKQNLEMLSGNEDKLGHILRDMLSGYLLASSDIDSVVMDSIIHHELRERGITTPYDFGIYNPYESRFSLARTKEAQKLQSSQFKQPMAISPRHEESYLMLFFPRKTQYLLRNIWFLLLASAFLIFIIIFSFAYTVSTLFRQKKVQDIKTDLINNITHELKTPISTISLACQAMNDPDLANSPLRNNYVQMIDDENKRLALLVENVLQSAVYEKGDFKLKIKRVDMHVRIDKALASLGIQARNHKIRIVRELEASEPVIEADEVMVTNLIFNLVDNAIKYFRPGDPYIAVHTRTEGDYFVLEVSDNGIGITKDNQKRIFEKLYRVPTGNVHNVKGYGLGLSYVRSIVERHHGTIEVESQMGEGSTFRIRLPLKQHVFN